MQAYDELKRIVSEIEDDVRKAEGGNRTAGTRVRNAMQKVKEVAQTIRVQVLEAKKGPASSAGGSQDGAAGEGENAA